MRLIIEAGSTKMEWILLDGNKVKDRFQTEGFNPNYADIQILAEKCHAAFLPNEIQSVHYYGTGCGNEQNCQLINKVFRDRFPKAEIHVTHDLMAACHAVLGHEKGIACILGTGSNSCVYDGENIVEKAVSLGYLVGDEGSGMHIGKTVVKAYFYGFMPEDLRQKFAETYRLALPDFVQTLYHNPQPSKYLASFAKFAGENQTHPFFCDIVRSCFQDFIEIFVRCYEDCYKLKISFVGSVAYHFQDILRKTLSEFHLTMGEVLKAPAEGLIRHYQHQ